MTSENFPSNNKYDNDHDELNGEKQYGTVDKNSDIHGEEGFADEDYNDLSDEENDSFVSENFVGENFTNEYMNADLLKKYSQTKNIELRHQIVLNNFSLVRYIAKNYQDSGETIDDLIQVGYIGLIKAVDGYDSEKNVKFSTYATHKIRGEIRHYLRDKSSIIKRPRWIQSIYVQIIKAIEELTRELGRPPTLPEIAGFCNIKEEGISEILKAVDSFKITSLDGTKSDRETENFNFPLIDRIKSQRYVTFKLPVEDRIAIIQAIEQLKILEKDAIFLFFYKDLTQIEIAKKLGVSQKHVSRLIKKSLDKLKDILSKDKFF
ncbi:MAG: sigma-70 family RNA polymerase sigma factor [Candidatus Eremiobacterota bacterium]